MNETSLLATRSAKTIMQRFVLDVSKPWNPLFDMYQVGILLMDSEVELNAALVELRDLLLSKNFSLTTVKRAVSRLSP